MIGLPGDLPDGVVYNDGGNAELIYLFSCLFI